MKWLTKYEEEKIVTDSPLLCDPLQALNTFLSPPALDLSQRKLCFTWNYLFQFHVIFFSPPSLIIISDNTPIEDIYIAFYIFSSLFWQSKIYSFVNFFFFFFIYRFLLSVKKTKIDILLFETLDVIMFIFCMLVEDGWPLVILAVKPFSFLFFLTFITALLAPKLFAFGLKRFLLLKDVKSKNPNSLFHFLFVTCVEIFLLQNLLDCAFPFFLILF